MGIGTKSFDPRGANAKHDLTGLAPRPVRLVFTAYLALIAIGLAFYIAIGITSQ